jgi:hypothetical protein
MEIGEVDLSADDFRPAIEVDDTKTSEEESSLDIAFFNFTQINGLSTICQ